MTEQERDQRIAEEFATGTDIPEVAARHGLTEAHVDRIIEEATLAKPQREKGLANWGNRLVLSLAVGWLAWLATFRLNYWVIPLVGIGFFTIVSAIVGRRR